MCVCVCVCVQTAGLNPPVTWLTCSEKNIRASASYVPGNSQGSLRSFLIMTVVLCSPNRSVPGKSQPRSAISLVAEQVGCVITLRKQT